MNRIVYVFALLVLANVTLCQLTATELSEIKTTTWSIADDAGKTISIIIKVTQMISLLMLLADVFSRWRGKPLFFGHALRFAFFIYGACTPWLLGGNQNYAPMGYRDANDFTLSHYFDQIYHGYFGSGHINVFHNDLQLNGTKYGFLYINILAVEILVFFLLKTAAWATEDGLAHGNWWSNFLASLKNVWFNFFAFPFLVWGVFFMKQHFVMLDEEDNGAVVTGRNHVTYWFSMLICVWMLIEVAMLLVRLVTVCSSGVETFPENDNRMLDGAINNVTPGEVITENCTNDAMFKQCAYMQQWWHKSAFNGMARYYNFVWTLRWMVFAVFSLIWYKNPRTLYIIYFFVNIFMICFTAACASSFRWAYGLILAEEVLIFLWHMFALINYLDYYGKRGMGKFWVHLGTWVIFWSFVVTWLLELVMLIGGATKNRNYFGRMPVATVAAEVDNKLPVVDSNQVAGNQAQDQRL